MNTFSNVQAASHKANAPSLDTKQVGHIRHLHNLANRQPNDWSLMQGRGIDQEDFGGAYRFQLAFAAYALALAHFHRLPNASGVFRPTIQRLIEKMLEPAVWLYWRDISRGGSVFNEHLTHNLTEQWDPIGTDNIMYSAYLQSMSLMYNYMFRDDRFAQPGALTVKYWSFFWGGPEKRFEYDQNSINELLYWKMVESGYLGIACEPNCVFQICNQPTIIGFRMHDILTGGNRAADVTRSYEQAWLNAGRMDETGHYATLMLEDSKTVLPNSTKSPWVDMWLSALMNAWNRDYVRAHYKQQMADYLERDPDGELAIKVVPTLKFGDMSSEADWADYGWVAACASEMGDLETLNAALDNADQWMKPSWRDGGFYYPRNDEHKNERGKVTLCDPMTGNVLLGYARLNVEDGLWKFYNQPWGDEHFREPDLRVVAPSIDVSKAWFGSDDNALLFDLRRWDGGEDDGHSVTIANVWDRGDWELSANGQLVAKSNGQEITWIGEIDVRRTEDTLTLVCPPGETTAFSLVFQ